AHVAGQQVVVLREAGDEVRVITRYPAARASLLRAALRRPTQTRDAPSAREEIVVDDAIALMERLARRVGLDAGAEGIHAASHLVAHGPPALGNDALTAEPVQIAATHVGVRDLHQDGARLRIRERIALDLPRSVAAAQDRDSPVHTGPQGSGIRSVLTSRARRL